MKPEATFAVVILAAGGSRRLGQPKQLLEVSGQPLVARAVDAALASSAWPVVVVIGSEAARVRAALVKKPVLIVENPAWPEGMASSLRSGVAAVRQFSKGIAGVVVALCDQPGLSGKAIDALIDAQRASGASVVAARYASNLGAPVLFTASRFPELETLTGDQGARILIKADPHVVPVDLPEFESDIDTPEDLKRLRDGH